MNKHILPEFSKFLKSQLTTVILGFILIFLLVNIFAVHIHHFLSVDYSNLASMILQQILLFALISYLAKRFTANTIQHKVISKASLIYNIVLTFIYFFLISIVVNIFNIPGFGVQENILNLFPSSGFGLYLTIFIFTLIGPITEEILFRGFLLGSLLKKCNKLTAITLSSIIFSLIHFQVEVILPLFILSFLISNLYLKTQSIQAAIYFHIINNSLKTYLLLYLI